MPIYEYECKNCGVFEIEQKITDPPISKCSVCKGRVNKIMSVSTFILKGSGWFKDGYSSNASDELPSIKGKPQIKVTKTKAK
jgi:putative FmdB family regulatory protein